MNITWIGSPNVTPGRGGNTVDKIVIHWMDARLQDTDRQFQIDGSQPPYPGRSAHFGVEDGNVHQYVKLENVAWHANNFRVNQQSVGIEFSADPYRLASDATYETGGELIARIGTQLGLTPSRALLHPHHEYSNTECCGTMDLDRLAARAQYYHNAAIGDVQTGSALPAQLASYSVPIHFFVNVTVPALRVRTGPGTSFHDIPEKMLHLGDTVECQGVVSGELVNGESRWLHTAVSGLFIWAGATNYHK